MFAKKSSMIPKG